jgi:Tetratricopeptide repeat.
MRLSSLILGSLVAVMWYALPMSAPAETPAAEFEKGNHEFADRNFKDAIASYESVVKSGEWSANLFYNLANAYYRERDVGRAILNYERALRIDPHHPEAQANLRLTREETHALELSPSPATRFLDVVNPSVLAIAVASLFWAAFILLIWRIRTANVVAAICCLIACAICALGIYSIEHGIRGATGAIVVQDNLEARVATADSAQSILALPAGSEVLVLQPRGDWSYVVLPTNRRGWVSAKAIARIWL